VKSKAGKKITPVRDVNITYPYFMSVFFPLASMRTKGVNSFFWGQCVLIIWALAPFRSRRFGAGAWALAVAVAVGIAFLSQRGVRELQRAIEGYNAQWMARFFHGPTTDSQTEHDSDGSNRAAETVRQNCHPSLDGKWRIASHLSA